MAALVALPGDERMDFVSLKEISELTDGNLSSHLSTLEQAGYVSVTRSLEGKKTKTRICVTPQGREAFSHYVVELERLIRGDIS
jgi:DNA-binding MarR family transcriptional regulator